MANSQVQYITIDEVVRNLLITEGKDTEHDYMRYYQLGLNGLKELSFDILQEIRTARISVNSNTHSIELPLDYINYTKIGLCKDGRVAWMAEDKTMCLPNSFEYEQADTPTIEDVTTQEFTEIYSNTTGSTTGYNPYTFANSTGLISNTVQTTSGAVEIISHINAGGTNGASFQLSTANGLTEALIQGEKYRVTMDMKQTVPDNANAGIRVVIVGLAPGPPTSVQIVDSFNQTVFTQVQAEFIAGSGTATIIWKNFQGVENILVDNIKVERITETTTTVTTFENSISGAPGSSNSILTNNIDLETSPHDYNSLGRRYGKGGGQNKNGYYRIDKENGTIYFSSDVSGDILLEYVSDGSTMIAKEKSKGANTITTTNDLGEEVVTTDPEDVGFIENREFRINVFAVEALMAYIYWQSIQRRRGVNMNEKLMARKEFYNQKRLAKSRLMSFTIEEALNAGRKGFKQSPKS